MPPHIILTEVFMNKKIRLVNYPALAGTVLLIVACVAGYFLIGRFIPEDNVATQILNVMIGVILVFSVFDLWYLFRAGLVVEDGILMTGKGSSGLSSDGFPVKELTDISLILPDGTPVDGGKCIYPRVNVVFHLGEGRRKTYEGHMLTRGQYRRICALLIPESGTK